jgi:DNA-binding NarL/FixJ family response regulator
MIRLQPDLELAGLATSADQAVEFVREWMPQVVIMDLDLPERTAIRSIAQICRLHPDVCVLGSFTHPEDDCAPLAIRAGARACLTKDRLTQDLVLLIRKCLGG